MSLDHKLATNRQHLHMAAPRGFSLVELMVAIVIGLILITVVGQSFLTGRATYQTEEGLSRIQENARFAIDFMSRDIRMAGYLGCQGRNAFANGNVTNLLQTGNVNINSSPLIGYEYTGTGGSALSDWTPALPSEYFGAGDVLPGTDVLVIQRASDVGLPLTNTMTTESANIFVPPNTELNDGDIVFVSDCAHADLIQITTTNPSSGEFTHNTGSAVYPGNKAMGGTGNSQKLSKIYEAGTSQVFKLLTQIYYVANRASTNTPALYRKTMEVVPTGTPTTPTATYSSEELVENVESMHIEYVRDLNDATQPISRQVMTAATIAPISPASAGWSRVTSVRVGLLLRSEDNADQTPDTRTYMVAHQTIAAANDMRRRRAFNFTVQLRN